MKMIKNMKKLKFWSRKKKKKNPAANGHCCCHKHEFQASAPPLPPYYEQIQEASYANYHTFSGHPSVDFRYAFPSEETHIDPQIKPLVPPLPVTGTSSSYHQYMLLLPNPVYGMPVVTTQTSFGVFGCVFNVANHLLRVACPCFRIKEPYSIESR